MVVFGVTTSLPLVGFVPVQPSEAVQLVALVLDQLSVLDWLALIDVGVANKVTGGVSEIVTQSVALWLPSLTLSWKLSAVALVTLGATKLGWLLVGFIRLTAGPAVWLQT